MRRAKLSSESGRIWAGMGGVLLMAAGAAVIAMVAFSAGSPAGRVPVAQADHDSLTQAEIDALPNGTKILICHTEGNSSQHTIEPDSESWANAGHFDAAGNPLHAVGDVHDFIIQVEGMDPINDEADCNAVAATATQAIATATQQVETTSTPTTVPPTNTPEATATLAVATATQQVEATSTPTNTAEPTATEAVPPTNTPEPTATTSALLPASTPTATPVPLVVEVQAAQATPAPGLPPAAPLDVPPTPAPAVTTLPATGSGGYEDNSMALIIGVAMILAGTSISFMAVRRRAQ